MCVTCGCEAGSSDHNHDHDHDHAPARGQRGFGVLRPTVTRTISLEQDLLAKNDRYAAVNRGRFAAAGVLTLNLVSSPGSGKTTLLVETLLALAGRLPVAVIEGDQQTRLDADRIAATGAPVVQLNTGKGCHLDAHQVGHALATLAMPARGILFIENVGNLVCPASFDLGEAHKVVVLSVTEGDDKPLKYPDMFRAADLCLITKSDLLPYVPFSADRAAENARAVHPGLECLILSSTTHDGFDAWLAWLERAVAQHQPVGAQPAATEAHA